MKDNKISIIVPVYKVEQYLNQCVESAINQTYKNLEIILVDDGSPDNCPKMCDEWAEKDKRIKAVHKTNGGVSSARNDGLKIASGDYIMFVDSDDYIESDTLQKIEYRLNNESLDLLIFNLNYIKESKIIKNKTRESYNLANANDFVHMFSDNLFCGPVCKVFKRKVLNYEFDINLFVAEDLDFVYHNISNCKQIGYLDEALYNYVIHDGSAITKYQPESLENKKTVFEKFIRWFFNRYKDVSPKTAQKFFTFIYQTHFLSLIITISRSKLSNNDKKIEIKKVLNDEFVMKIKKSAKTQGVKYKILNILLQMKLYGLVIRLLKK